MEWLEALRFAAAESREFQLVTSLVTLLEVLVRPLRTGREDLAREYRDILLQSASLRTIAVSEMIAEEAELCYSPNVKLVALQLPGHLLLIVEDMVCSRLPGNPGMNSVRKCRG